MGPTSCSQAKKTGGLKAQEQTLGKMCYRFSPFGVGRFIIGVGVRVEGGHLGVKFDGFTRKEAEKVLGLGVYGAYTGVIFISFNLKRGCKKTLK